MKEYNKTILKNMGFTDSEINGKPEREPSKVKKSNSNTDKMFDDISSNLASSISKGLKNGKQNVRKEIKKKIQKYEVL